MTAGDVKYRDTLFRFLFGQERFREWTLSLFNAVNDTAYTDSDQIQFTAIESVNEYGVKSDVSFLFKGELSQYEHQSTYNPNMPLRQLGYTMHIFEDYIKKHDLKKYGNTQINLPAPRLVVFYNGSRRQPEEEYRLFLRDAFPAEADVEARVRVIDINFHRRGKVLQACRPLWEYAWLIEQINQNCRTMELGKAINQAIRQMPEDFVIKTAVKTFRTEGKGMIWGEFRIEECRQELLAEGREEGVLSAQLMMIRKKLSVGKSVSQIADEMEMEVPEVQSLIKLINEHPAFSIGELCALVLETRQNGQQVLSE